MIVLFVCTGNICRSPAAERLLAAALGSPVTVSSAGTHALVGQPVWPPMAALLSRSGASPDGFSARRLTAQLLRPAELVLTMTQQHRRDAVELWPKAVRHTFTLKEYARLLSGLESSALPEGSISERLRCSIPLAAAQRRRLADTRQDDVIDPYLMSEAICAESFADIERAVGVINRKLRAPSIL